MLHRPALVLTLAALACSPFAAVAAERGVSAGGEPAAIRTEGYSAVVKEVGPSVVTVFSSRTLQARRADLPEDLPPMFRDLFGGPGGPDLPEGLKQEGLGSGVVVSADGYILTNHHVVKDADEVRVRLANNYDEFPAKVVGSDAKSDLAVLKIDVGSIQLKPVRFADSTKAEVGDVVLAIGNPLGVGQTVTMGIVSAVNRGVGIVDYEDFIQTDAAINMGNSGGALVSSAGELLGINTAILSRSGGSIGIGFAVPANLARGVMEQIIADGKVVRGFLGVMIQPVTPDLAKAMKLKRHEGALVGDVTADSPAAKAGLRAGDVIVAYGDQPIADPRQLRLRVSQSKPGTSVPVTLVRKGEEQRVEVAVGTLSDDAEVASGKPDADPSGGNIGVRLQDLDERARRRLRLPDRVQGALVGEVLPGSRAAEAGLRPGDVIHEVDGTAVDSAKAAVEAIRAATEGSVVLRIWSQGGSRFLAVPVR
jgi:serine protease Do